MTQEKDQKSEREGSPGRSASKTMMGGSTMGSSRPPRPSDRLSKAPAAPPLTGQSARDLFPDATTTSGPGQPVRGHRERQASLEEISNSLLLSDDSSSAVMPGLEELSGSLLLEDPTEVRPDLMAPVAPVRVQPSTGANAPVRSGSTAHGSVAHAAIEPREPPAAHQALLGMPALPTSTPAPDLDKLAPAAPAALSSPTGALRPPHLEDTARSARSPGNAHGAPAELELDDPTRIVPPPPQHMYEALKGYEAEPDPVAPVDPPAPRESTRQTAPVQGDVETTSIPPSGFVAAIESFKLMLGRLRSSFANGAGVPEKRRPIFLAAIALGGLVVGIAIVALVVALTRKEPDAGNEVNAGTAGSAASSGPAMTASTQTAAQVAPPPLAVAAIPAPAPATAPASTTGCTVVSAGHVVAPSAIVQAGIEVRAVGNDVALGYASNEHQATALRLDATSLATTSKVDSQSTDALRRVVPLVSADGALAIAGDADREGDAIQGRRTLPLDPPLEVGSAGGNLVWAHPNGAPAGTLWPLDGTGDVEALRGASDAEATPPISAVAFRRSSAIWLGATSGHDALAPMGGLTRVGGSGDAVGSPAVAVNDGVVLAAWADRASSSDPWRLRWVTFKAGEAPGEPGTFTPPAGGRGEQAMSPGLAAVSGGRFLLVWTEGPATRHDVRALTLSREGQPIGKPLVISNKNVNAGQGQVAVNAAGHGVVAFLESAAGRFQIVATAIRCAP